MPVAGLIHDEGNVASAALLDVVGSAPVSVCCVVVPSGVYAISHDIAGTDSPVVVVVATDDGLIAISTGTSVPGSRCAALVVEREAGAEVGHRSVLAAATIGLIELCRRRAEDAVAHRAVARPACSHRFRVRLVGDERRWDRATGSTGERCVLVVAVDVKADAEVAVGHPRGSRGRPACSRRSRDRHRAGRWSPEASGRRGWPRRG